MKKSGDAKPKPKKDSDIVRERIIRRAALEFQDGMYGILFSRKARFTTRVCKYSECHVVCIFVSRLGLFFYFLFQSARVDPSCQAQAGHTLDKFIMGSQRKTNNYSLQTYSRSQFMHMHVVALWEEAGEHTLTASTQRE